MYLEATIVVLALLSTMYWGIPAAAALKRGVYWCCSQSTFFSSTILPYTSLDENNIRLLVIHAGQKTDDIDCSLCKVSLNNNTVCYSALSYTWGPPVLHKWTSWKVPNVLEYIYERCDDIFSFTRTISVNGYRVKVANNLHQALWYLRKSDQDIIVWADAICINQRDNQEKACQVRLMHRIYKQAKTTYAWLGPPADDSDCAMDVIGQLASAEPDLASPNLDMEGVASGREWDTVFALLGRSWWGRIWVVQEALLSSHVIVKCGEKEVPLEKFHWLATLEFRLTHRVLTEAAFYDKHKKMVESMELTLQTRTPLFDLLPSWRTFRSEVHDHGLSLWRLILKTSNFRATMPRDKIYALLGLVPPNDRAAVPVDYGVDSEDGIIFKKIIAHVIRSTQTIEPLRLVRKDTRSMRGIPSWVPNLGRRNLVDIPFLMSESSECDKLACGPLRSGYRIKEDHLDGPDAYSVIPGVSVSRDNCVLTVCGIRFDTVEILEPAVMSDIFIRHAVRKWERKAHEYSINPYYTQGQLYDAFWRTLILNKQPGVTGKLDTQFSIPDKPYKQAFEQCVRPNKFSNQLRLNEDSEHQLRTKKYWEVLRNVVQSRAFIITRRGYLGMAPTTTKPGDVVCVFQDGPAPFIVRPMAESERWELVGECYIHGIMEGEAVSEASKLEKFSLI